MASAVRGIEAVSWLPLCIKQLGLQGLACLATCSKQLNHDCNELLKTDASAALLGTLEAAVPSTAEAATSAAGSRMEEDHHHHVTNQAIATTPSAPMEEDVINGAINALAWLLTKAPKEQEAELTAMAAEHVVRYPNVPMWQVVQFCGAGVRISNALLLEAANSMVPGVEVWVLAQQEQHIKTDISPAAVSVCRSAYGLNPSSFLLTDILKKGAAEDLPDLLQLAMNCKRPPRTANGTYIESPPTAVAAVDSLPAELEPAVARRLLVTAAARHGAGVTSSLVARDSVRQHLDAATFESVTTHLLAAKTCNCAAAVSKPDWWQLPAVVELTSAAVGRLLQSVVNQPAYLMPCGSLQCVEQLCSLPAAEKLSCNSLESLLHDACQRRTVECVEPLFALPTAKEIGTNLIVQLLFAASKRGGCHQLGMKLRDLPGVGLISSDTVVQLLKSAVQQKYADDAQADVEYLKGLPAAKRVSRSDMTHLVMLASTLGRAECVAVLQAVKRTAE